MRTFRNIYLGSRFGDTWVGEIVNLNGRLFKVVETNEDVCARMRPLNKIERFGLWLAGLLTFIG